MTYATNPSDGVRSYVEDWGGSGAPVVVYAGLADPLESSQRTGLAQALRRDFRLVFADHRGHGRSDKPHAVEAYALVSRVGDFTAVLDALSIPCAHVLGFSWGARLGFAIGEHAPRRVLSLVLCGNQPYAWDRSWSFVPALSTALDAARTRGMRGFIDSVESSLGERISEPTRSWVLDNDPAAIGAAWQAALTEGPVSQNLANWRVPCLIYMAAGEDMYDNAVRAAAEIPDSRFLALENHTHLSAPEEVDAVLPHVLELFRSVQRTR